MVMPWLARVAEEFSKRNVLVTKVGSKFNFRRSLFTRKWIILVRDGIENRIVFRSIAYTISHRTSERKKRFIFTIEARAILKLVN